MDGRGAPLLHRRPHAGLGGLDGARRLALELLDDQVRHCVAGALAAGDEGAAAAKTEELLAAVERFARAG